MLIVSIIILLVNAFLELFEGGDIDEPVLEGNRVVIVVSQQLHYLSLPAAFEGGHVVELETEVALVKLASPEVLLLGDRSLTFGGVLAEEVVPVEQPVSPNGPSAKPQRSHSTKPPVIGLCDEVCVVKHQ